MSIEQDFINLIKEGKISDAMETIKSALTEMAGSTVVETKFDIAEQYGMKKLKEEDEDKEEKDDDGDDDKDEDDKDEKDTDKDE